MLKLCGHYRAYCCTSSCYATVHCMDGLSDCGDNANGNKDGNEGDLGNHEEQYDDDCGVRLINEC